MVVRVSRCWHLSWSSHQGCLFHVGCHIARGRFDFWSLNQIKSKFEDGFYDAGNSTSKNRTPQSCKRYQSQTVVVGDVVETVHVYCSLVDVFFAHLIIEIPPKPASCHTLEWWNTLCQAVRKRSLSLLRWHLRWVHERKLCWCCKICFFNELPRN